MAGEAEDASERLQEALWHAVGKIVDEESMRRNRNTTPQFIGALADMVSAQIETAAIDLENFSRHAGRTTVNTDDVLLLARRNNDLRDLIKEFIDKQKAVKGKAKAKK